MQGQVAFASSAYALHLQSSSRNSFVSPSFTEQRNPLRSLRKRAPIHCSLQGKVAPATTTESLNRRRLEPLQWNFRGATVEYLAWTNGMTSSAAVALPAIVLVHGFGANCKHWRNNIVPLAQQGYRVFSMDLLGFGMSDKPSPGTVDDAGTPVAYNFDYWAAQLRAFVTEVVQGGNISPVFFVANSIGSMVTMQAAVEDPSLCAAQVFISPSLRQLNVRKRSWIQNIVAPALMKVLGYRPIGAFFLDALAQPKQLKSVLLNAYKVQDAVDDELLSILSKPAFTDGALEVFLAFIMYDEGPIPEDFLPKLDMPSLILWGAEDDFEPIGFGRPLGNYNTVKDFVEIPGVGHCAHDEAPEFCNEKIVQFFAKHSPVYR